MLAEQLLNLLIFNCFSDRTDGVKRLNLSKPQKLSKTHYSFSKKCNTLFHVIEFRAYINV